MIARCCRTETGAGARSFMPIRIEEWNRGFSCSGDEPGRSREARELTWDIPGLSMHESGRKFPILPDPRLNAPRPIRDARVTLLTESAKEIPGGSFLSNPRSLDLLGQEETN